MSNPLVAICTVTHNAARDLPSYLKALDRVSYHPLEVMVVDCASSDDTCQTLERASVHDSSLRLIELGTNSGFAGGMNRAIAETSAPFILSLNADALPEPDYVERLLERFHRHPEIRIGAVTGRLARPVDAEGPRLDAAGMRLVPSWRHLDRGSDERDVGQYGQAERVFGGTGAATLFYRPALDDTKVDGEFFLSEFHSFREDAELSFRLRERGWEIIYEPLARASHRRHNLPRRRKSMSSHVNYHSLKNRYLLRAYHETFASFLVTSVPSLFRDLGALSYVLLRERSSLPVFGWLWRNRRHIIGRRKRIQSRRRVSRRQLAAWFLTPGRPL